ncbi:hypothetical protein [Aureibacter tunicatorum]|uniref:DUF4848 domain-containing protein n=1 Tax=Aureibacter tunicatorum TaxID=866807 RepID=A0AAE3XL10_9BACT|nr:hypothetical protein [Aureibacter tunicatorum]MDR6238372.1 hypothetical protein [Aureibacter tunicatorum]BDD03404.1 hypothetical protein AUTU_08870 [Aureibacter tunicatorum]
MKKINFLLVAIMAIFISSCSNDGIEDSLSTKDAEASKSGLVSEKEYNLDLPKIVDDRMYFENFDHMNEFMKVYQEIEPDYLDEKSKEADFISWNDVLNAEEGQEIPRKLNNLVDSDLEDPRLVRLLNYNQEIRVGELICRIEDEYVFMYVDGNFDQVEAFKAKGIGEKLEYDEPVLINEKLIAAKPLKEIKDDESKRSMIWIFGYGWRCSNNYNSYNSSTRMKSTHWATNVYFYKSAGMKTKMQKKKGWWIFKSWKSERAKKISVQGQVHFSVSGVPFTQTQNFNKIRYNSSSATHTIFWAVGFGVKIKAGNITGISGASGASVKIKNSSYSNHYTEYGSSSRSRGPKFWPW